MTVRIGFLGAGFITKIHGFLLERSGVDHAVVAVHDPDPERAAAFATRTGAEAVSEEALFAGVDAVYVTAWTSEHPRLVARAATLGLGVFCEKPLATDAIQAAQMVDAVEVAGVPNQVGLVLRSLPSFRQLERLIHDERAGRVMACSFRDDQALPVGGMYGSSWRTDPSKAGRGALLEHSIHDLDILRVLLGPVRSTSGVVREFHGLSRIDDVAMATLQFQSGAVANLASVWHDMEERPSQRFVEIFCERLYVALEGELRGPVRWRFAGEDEQVLEGRALRDAFADTAANPASSFLGAVRDGGVAAPSFAEALPAHRLADAIYASAENGGAIVEDPEGARQATSAVSDETRAS